MKTSEIAQYIQDRNVRLYLGTNRPLLPLIPVGQGRSAQEVAWFACQLIAVQEATMDAHLFVNQSLGAFGFFLMREAGQIKPHGWEPVEFDGYGRLKGWKELFREVAS